MGAISVKNSKKLSRFQLNRFFNIQDTDFFKKLNERDIKDSLNMR